jgi:hypothetical protein
MARIARLSTVSLALALAVLAGACSRQAKQEAKPGERTLAAIWGDVLARRDSLHELMTKPLEDVTHEDCAKVRDDAREVGDLMQEFGAALTRGNGLPEGQLRTMGEVVTSVAQVAAQIRAQALNEAPGSFVKLRYPFDQSLRQVESYLSADDLGGQSVVRRPDFETSPPPEGLSPI